MQNTLVVLDHILNISIDPENSPFGNYQAFKSSYAGLKILADLVREYELKYIADDLYAAGIVFHMPRNAPDLVQCSFNWFSVTLVNYLRLVGLVQLMNTNGWKSDAIANPAHTKIIKAHCTTFVKTAIPDIYCWRNKVSAHFAATDPLHNDNLGTLEHSIMDPVTYKYPHYYVGLLKRHTSGEVSELPSWSLTKVYEELGVRFWPEMQLQPIPTSGV